LAIGNQEGSGSTVAANDDKQRVLAAADIVRVISDHVTLKAKGREKVGLCPFHEDRNPSMYVIPHKQIFHCFVCGAGGDAITFVMDYHKMSFGEALQYLGDRFGVKLTPWQPKQREPGDTSGPEISREQLAIANATAQAYFRAILAHPEHGAGGRAVLAKRRVSAEAIEKFGLGTSADRWDGLGMFIEKKQLDPANYLGAGLLKSREYGGGLYDALRNRITFPIHDMLGRVIAFGARRINDEDDPKYLNSPETGLFNKSATLYAIHHAAEAIRKEGRAVVCEGYMDAIACHQAGVCNVVATLGTALTSQSARVLQRLCDTVILLFDGDEAGQRAADRAIEVLFTSALDVKIATLANLPPIDGIKAKDPDDLVKLPGGVAALRSALDAAVDALDYRYQRLKAEWAGMNLSAKAQAVEAELQRLVEMGLSNVSPVRKQMIIRRIADISSVDEPTIRRVITAATSRAPQRAPLALADAAAQNGPPLRSAFEHLLACLLADDKLLMDGEIEPQELVELLRTSNFDRPEFAALATHVVSMVAKTITDPRTILSNIEDPQVSRTAIAAISELSRQCEESPLKIRRHLYECINSCRRKTVNDAIHSEPAPQQSDPSVAGWAARLSKLQQANVSVGKDSRSVPRPMR